MAADPAGRPRTPWYDEPVMPASSLAVEARDLAKTFRSGWLRRRETEALRGATLQVERGQIFGLLGPNGAGKTTLLSILATLLLPDRGHASILGHDVVREAFAIRRRLNMASGNASFVWSLRPAEVLAFYGRLYGLHGRALKYPVDQTKNIVRGLYQIVTGKEKADVGSVVRITDEFKQAFEVSFERGIQLLMMLSVYLGLFNLFPLPALDGGRLVFLGYEMVTRRRANPKIEAMIHMGGILVLGVILILVTIKDCRHVGSRLFG